MTPDQMKDASLLELYCMEAEAQAQVLDVGLLVLEREPGDTVQLEACMRAAHSLKGAARIVGLEDGVKVAHAMEDLLVAAQEGLLRLLPEQIDGLLQGTDLLRRVGLADAQQVPLPSQVERLVEHLQDLLGAAVPMLGRTPVVSEPVAATVETETPEELSAESRGRVLRVSAERLDDLLDMSGKSLVEFQRIQPLSDALLRLKRQQLQTLRTVEALREATLHSAIEARAGVAG